MSVASPYAEWLESDALGGFTSGTVCGERTRRYHALLLVATTPPTGRMVLVNGADVFLATLKGRFALSSQRYTPDVVYPDGAARIDTFLSEPWPGMLYAFADACVRTQPPDRASRSIQTILTALRACLETTGIGHLPEIVNGDPPFAPGGCPFQAWSLAALLRMERLAAKKALAV